jgi:hypothetical protein
MANVARMAWIGILHEVVVIDLTEDDQQAAGAQGWANDDAMTTMHLVAARKVGASRFVAGASAAADRALAFGAFADVRSLS